MKIKINLMDTKANPSDDEIRSYMDFDKLIGQAGRRTGRTGMRKWWLALPLALAALSVIVYLNLRSGDQEKQATTPDQAEAIQGVSTLSPVEMKPDDSHAPNARKNEVPSPADSASVAGASSSSTEKNTRPVAPANSGDKKTAAINPREESSMGSKAIAPDATDVYVQAEPREGYTQLYAYFKEHLKYPADALRDSIEGIETVSFTIDERGKPVRIHVTHSLGRPFDEEAMRLIQNMPDWKPATLNGRPVASQLSVPLTFQLRRTK